MRRCFDYAAIAAFACANVIFATPSNNCSTLCEVEFLTSCVPYMCLAENDRGREALARCVDGIEGNDDEAFSTMDAHCEKHCRPTERMMQGGKCFQHRCNCNAKKRRDEEYCEVTKRGQVDDLERCASAKVGLEKCQWGANNDSDADLCSFQRFLQGYDRSWGHPHDDACCIKRYTDMAQADTPSMKPSMKQCKELCEQNVMCRTALWDTDGYCHLFEPGECTSTLDSDECNPLDGPIGDVAHLNEVLPPPDFMWSLKSYKVAHVALCPDLTYYGATFASTVACTLACGEDPYCAGVWLSESYSVDSSETEPVDMGCTPIPNNSQNIKIVTDKCI